ncbi:MAG: twin-arginine translocase TatA/TatE family subunit [Crocinitomicaceae bacterium]|jgi:sec-independent protein translocase protein TatA|nr:twin-arginine translocase TatA/TatE family subunit [Crocinitomicaceae bacterium]MDG1735423.1 twin-arginine translocase TatA/TatE family subunit [Crocinitomicaceae bacterium]MDG2506065.1 twin-arginine translocase TatA/TatE family subunit [Crocinitomicaceae bacterium]
MMQALFLNDIAGTEILLILVFVLIFFGAKSIPSIAKTLGRAIYQIKNASDDLKSEIKKSTGDLKNDLNLNELIKETEEEIQLPMDQMMTDIENTINYEPKNTKKK